MRHFRSKGFHISWALAVLSAGAAVFYIEKHYQPPPILDIPASGHELTRGKIATDTQARGPLPQNGQPTVPTVSSYTFPKTYLLKIPFSSQAPTANWDQLHNEACEETSAIMAAQYLNGNTSATLPADLVESELAKITDWEKQTFGYYLDINSEETAQLLMEFYGLKAQVLHNLTLDEIKTELSQNRVILWPANGQKLGNPNFRQPGPPYHMLVIKGWDSKGIITNDPGTRKGQNYFYTYETLYNANGDWSHNLNAVDEGNKTAIIVWK